MAKKKNSLNNELRITFSKSLRELMNAKKIATNDLAEVLGVTRQAVGKYMNGQGYPDLSLVIKLSDLFGVTVDELLTGKKPENKTTRELLGLTEQAIENVKEIKNTTVTGNDNTKTSILPLLNNLLEDRDFLTLLVNLEVWAKQIQENPSMYTSFMKSEHTDYNNYIEWRLLNILSKFFIQNTRNFLREDFEQQTQRAREIAAQIE